MLRHIMKVLPALMAIGIFLSMLFGAPPGIPAVAPSLFGLVVVVYAAVLLVGFVSSLTSPAAAPFEIGWMAALVTIIGALIAKGVTYASHRRQTSFFTDRSFAVPIG